MAYSPHETRATNVLLTVTSGSHVTPISVDQTVALPSGSNMREVGIARLIAGQETVVTISTAGTTGFVILDALQFSLIKFAVTEIHHAADTNTLTLTWDSSPDESYRVAYSLDMTDWTNTLDTGISADTGDTTTRAFNLASAGIETEPRVFYRVEME